MSVETVEQPSSRRTSYPIYIHNVGGKEPDGKPTRIGKWTFATKMVRDVVLDNVHGRVLNACAGRTRLEKRGCEFVRNDLNPEVDADTHVDVRSIDEAFRRDEFDSAVNDPPFDAGRAAKLYEGFHAKGYMEAREAIAPLVRPGGTYIELGWNSWGLADVDGWERKAHHIYRQPFKADVHLVVDRRLNQSKLADGGFTEDAEGGR